MFKMEDQLERVDMPVLSKKRLQIFAEAMRKVNTNISLNSVVKRSVSIAKQITKANTGDILWTSEPAGYFPASFLKSEEAEQKQSCNIPGTISNWVFENREVYCTGHTNEAEIQDRKSTRLNSSHVSISYAVFCLKKKNESEGF